jgi:hypothetical protein
MVDIKRRRHPKLRISPQTLGSSAASKLSVSWAVFAKADAVALGIVTYVRHVGSHKEKTPPRIPLQVLGSQWVRNLRRVKSTTLVLDFRCHPTFIHMIADSNRFAPIPLVSVLVSVDQRLIKG